MLLVIPNPFSVSSFTFKVSAFGTFLEMEGESFTLLPAEFLREKEERPLAMFSP